MFVHDMGELYRPRYIIDFPTNGTGRVSTLRDIEAGLVASGGSAELRVRSLAVPPLGCGNGGLDWEVVRPIIERAFEELPEVQVLLYPPKSAPAPEKNANADPASQDDSGTICRPRIDEPLCDSWIQNDSLGDSEARLLPPRGG